jgi:hypothetical protein
MNCHHIALQKQAGACNLRLHDLYLKIVADLPVRILWNACVTISNRTDALAKKSRKIIIKIRSLLKRYTIYS